MARLVLDSSVLIAYFNTVVVQLAAFVFTDPVQAGCTHCPSNPLLIDHSQAGTVIATAQVDIAVALLGGVVAVLYRRWRGSTPSQRRAFAPVLAVGSLTFLLLMTELIVEQSNLSSTLADGLTLALFGSIACLPFAFLVGLLRFRFGQAEAISSLVSRLGGGGSRGGPGDPPGRGPQPAESGPGAGRDGRQRGGAGGVQRRPAKSTSPKPLARRPT